MKRCTTQSQTTLETMKLHSSHSRHLIFIKSNKQTLSFLIFVFNSSNLILCEIICVKMVFCGIDSSENVVEILGYCHTLHLKF